MKTLIYHIEAITNLQVGSGEINMGVVDNLIQRDAATGMPNINASGLKGALREHCAHFIKSESIMRHIFGSSPDELNVREAGNFRFFNADLLSMPVRSDKAPFLMATCPLLVNDYLTKRELFGLPVSEAEKQKVTDIVRQARRGVPVVVRQPQQGAYIEGLDRKAVFIGDRFDTQLFASWVGSPAVLLHDEDFHQLCDNDHLPVIARNNLTKGRENLWYEQVLPRFSRLYFFVLASEKENCLQAYQEAIKNRLVQIGANATVGYGYCLLTAGDGCIQKMRGL